MSDLKAFAAAIADVTRRFVRREMDKRITTLHADLDRALDNEFGPLLEELQKSLAEAQYRAERHAEHLARLETRLAKAERELRLK